MTDSVACSPDSNLIAKIKSEHLSRKAVVYIRQSTLSQVATNLESQRRQYALSNRLRGWGWSPSKIEVIDEDQGQSGADSSRRTGFQRLVTDVAMGNVGLIISLETSRLTRSNEDWQKLLTICEVRNTLLADAEGIYSLNIYNDRMLLGLKGTVSEIELHTLRERMTAGARSKAERGEMVFSVPAGYTVTDDGLIQKYPDEAVQGAIARIFQVFRGKGSVYGTAMALIDEGFLFPRRTDQLGRQPVRWGEPTHQSIAMLLHNPCYAGTYTWGRVETKPIITDEGRVIKRRYRRSNRSKWPIVLHDHHPGYITWQEFETNLETMTSNRRGFGFPGPVGKGRSILSGLVKCGFCGCTMAMSYGGKSRQYSHFHCTKRELTYERNPCQTFAGRTLERCVEGHLLSILEPQSFETVLIAEADIENERKRKIQRWDLEIERLVHIETRARQKFDEVEPRNRLVARALEQSWEAALRSLEEARQAREKRISALPPPLSEEERVRLRQAIGRMGELWRANSTLPEQRKEITRLLVHHVATKVNREAHRLDLEIHWVTGHTTRESLPLLRQKGRRENIRDNDLAIIEKMAPNYSDAEISMVLGKAARRTVEGYVWTARKVGLARKEHGWERRSGSGEATISMSAAARMMNTDCATLEKRIQRGELRGSRPYAGAIWRINKADVERFARSAYTLKRRRGK